MNRSAFRFKQPDNPLRFDGERFVSGLLGDVSSGDIQSEHYHRYLFALQFCNEKDVLDIASGEGYGSHCLGQVAKSVVGVDANAEAVDFANQNYLTDRVSFKVGKAQSIPIGDASIDIVVSFETLEHFQEHDAFASEVRRVLRPGGLLLISSPNRTVYTEEANYHNEWHLRELDRSEFLDYLAGTFAKVALLAQRPLAGSVIAIDDTRSEGRPEGFILRGDGVFNRTEGVPHPPFFIALASDAELPRVRSSLLQNPTLLRHLDTERQKALERAAQAMVQVAALETALAKAVEHSTAHGISVANATKEQAEREAALTGKADHALTEASQARAEAEQARAEAEKARAEAEKARAEAEQARAEAEQARAEAEQARTEAEQVRTEALQVKTEASEVLANAGQGRSATGMALDEEVAELRRALNMSHHSAGRIETMRHELIAARRRNVELANETSALRQERDDYLLRLNSIIDSTAWKVTSPMRRVASRLPPRVRSGWGARIGRLLPIQRPNRTAAVSETLEPASQVLLLQQEPADQAADRSPSDLQRQLDAAWVEPNERPEFIRLRGHQPRAKIAVVMHIYYPELWQELADATANIPEEFDLFVTLVIGASDGAAATIRERFPDAHVLFVDNHGRDILPFVALIRTGALFSYELICKIHSKRSTYREGGDQWRKSLVGGILGSLGLVGQIMEAFRGDPDLGIAVAEGQLFGGREFWVSNEARSIQLFRDIGLNPSAFERAFVGGSMYWIRPLILRTVDALRLSYDDFEPEPLSPDGFTAHAVERLVSVICYDAGMRVAESGCLFPAEPATSFKSPVSVSRVHVIANYLPQFHPTPENDAWWGKGFTEWTNVTKALPLFHGHRQPRLATDLGFYDLRLPEVRNAQADLARSHGITAFSYYYYWFNGRKLLNRPIEEVVASGKPDFPFMLCWANEPWTRNWDGLSKEILLPQDYAPGWERAFAADVAQIMRDSRYLRLNGKPMLALYRIAHFPDKVGSIVRLRSAFADEGFPDVHLMGGWLRVGDDEPLPENATDLGLDAYFEFPPHGIASQPLEIPVSDQAPGFAAHLYDYGATVDAVLDQLAQPQLGFRYRGVMMGWDNTARRGAKSFAFHGATPTNFRRWLRATLSSARAEAHSAETAVFINAWNEWAEGTYLEPDRDFGTGWLEAVASATADAERLLQSNRGSKLPQVRKQASVVTEPFVLEDFINQHLDPPIPERLARFASGHDRSHLESVRFGAEIYLTLELAMRKYFAKPIAEFENVLDFGCGAGRILRFMDPLMKGLCGCDVHDSAVGFAQANYTHAWIYRNDLVPPLAYAAEQFSLIYAVDIFSHLSLDAENQWLAELARVGMSGCIYLITVHGEWFVQTTLGDEAEAIMAEGFAWRKTHQREGTANDFPEYYENSFHTGRYIRDHWSRYFEIIDVVKGDDPLRYLGSNRDEWSVAVASQIRPIGQDLIVARKR